MPSSRPFESCLIQRQPCVDGPAFDAEQAAIPSLRQPTRAYAKDQIVRSKQSHATLAKARRRHREYPIAAAFPGRTSILSRRRTNDLSPRSPCHQPAELNTLPTENPTASKGRDDAAYPADSQAPSGKNSCFLCLQSESHLYTVVVDFTWPGKPIPKIPKRRSKASTIDTVKKSSTINEFQKEGTQAQVMQALQDAIYEQSGRWKRWLWCYEICTAEEVKVSQTLRYT